MTGAIHTELLLLKQNYYKTVLHYLVFWVCVIIHLHQKYDAFWMPTSIYEIKQSQDKKSHSIMKNETMA